MRHFPSGCSNRLLYAAIGILMSIWPKENMLAQNLVPNPSFEVNTMCPNGSGGAGPMLCTPWVSVIGTADYYHECSGNIQSSVPWNPQGFQEPRTGFAYVGGHQFLTGTDHREYIQAPLLQTLEAGHCYKVGFYTNLGNASCGINFMGALLTPNPVVNPFGMTPQVDGYQSYFSDEEEWVFIFDYIMATGNEAYITIGNFHSGTETNFDPSCNNPQWAYYYFEDVIVEEVVPVDIDIELDGPVTVCDSFLIEPTLNPDVSEVVYNWSDGSHNPTLTVFNSGEYTVTVHYGCSSDEASIEVEIFNTPAVDIGPDVLLCPGDSYSISLDPALGDYEWQDGSTDTDYTLSDAGQYHVVLDDGCDLTYDTIEVVVLDPPLPFSLGADTFLCPGEQIPFDFDPGLGDFEWQDGSQSSSYNIDDAGNYMLTITNMCGSESDEIEVTEIPYPFFDIGPDTSRICQGENIEIFIDPFIGSITWQDGSHNPEYTIQTSGVYSVTVANVCGFETDQMVVEVTVTPLVQLGPDIQTCTGDTFMLNALPNEGIFQWQDGSSSPTFEVTGTGLYALSVTNDCGFDRDTISITYLPTVIQPDLGPDLILCPGDHDVLHINGLSASILWNDGSTLDSLLVDTAGVYFVQVSNICGSASDTILVTLNDVAPVLSLPEDFTLCDGQSFILDANIAGVNYLWNDMSTQPQLLVSNPGMYSLTISNSCGTATDTIIISDGGIVPVVELGIDTSICESRSILLSPDASNVLNWLWQDGSTGPTFLVSSPGEYHVAVSNNCGVEYDTILIGALPAVPLLSLGPDTLICPDNQLMLTINIANVDILWYNGSTASQVVIDDPTQVFASISNVCGISRDTILVDLLPDIPSLDLGNDQTICPGEVITIEPGIPDVLYTWQDGSTGNSLSVTQEDWVSLMISNECGTNTDSLLIIESTDGPQLELGPDLTACEGDTIIIPSNISGVNYLWQDGSDNSFYIATASGTYYLDVNNLCGTDTDTIEVEISGTSPVTDLGSDTTLCEETLLILTSQPDLITTNTWQDGSTGLTFVVQSPGIYSLTRVNHCGESSDSIEILFIDAPQPFDLGTDTLLCNGEFLLLTVPDSTFEYHWQDGSSVPQFIATIQGTYSLQLENECGIQSDEIVIAFDDQVPVVELGSDTSLCIGDQILLDVTLSSPATYVWNNGESTSSIVVSTAGVYAVTVMTPCLNDTDEIIILDNPSCSSTNEIFLPNIISPNGDNINDVFRLFPGPGIEILSIDGSVFDRWGNLVFRSTSYPFIWDGKFGSSELMAGVYVYSMTFTYKVNNIVLEEKKAGDITVLK
ncbi:MAG TPA: gliding motility-associated C-terminal domain-containing protein [Saprospiraceae bacterium]|nr:gliding motility-associated C-terminal domain-containing protein [Saprospiraceae bacterium]